MIIIEIMILMKNHHLESIRGLSKDEEEGSECRVRFVTNEWVATFFMAPRGDLLTHHEVTRNPFCCS